MIKPGLSPLIVVWEVGAQWCLTATHARAAPPENVRVYAASYFFFFFLCLFRCHFHSLSFCTTRTTLPTAATAAKMRVSHSIT